MSDILSELNKFVTSWGNELVCVDTTYPLHAIPYRAPFLDSDIRLGFDWGNKVIYYESRADICALIHEMGHVFASKSPPGKIFGEDEFDFFGWEYLLALKAGLSTDEFINMNDAYQVTNSDGEDRRMGSLSKFEQIHLLEERVEYSKMNNLIIDGEPIAIR
jgi:hypothetical protein